MHWFGHILQSLTIIQVINPFTEVTGVCSSAREICWLCKLQVYMSGSKEKEEEKKRKRGRRTSHQNLAPAILKNKSNLIHHLCMYLFRSKFLWVWLDLFSRKCCMGFQLKNNRLLLSGSCIIKHYLCMIDNMINWMLSLYFILGASAHVSCQPP